MYQKENWIDFESEISKVIKQFNENMYFNNVKRWQLDDEINDLVNEYLEEIYSKYTSALRSMVILTDDKCEYVIFRQIRGDRK